MATLSRQMADFLAADAGHRIGAETAALVEAAFLDTAGCILSGREEPVTLHMAAWLEEQVRPRSEASMLFSERRSSAVAAAALNAASGHALDFDDVALAGHPSVVLVPALLAEAERSGLTGPALMQAYAKGYQVWADLLQRLPDPLHEKGWHPTAVLGTLGVAAAICAARNLPPALTVHALGIAASQASGLVANFGSMTKPMHAFWAVEKGMTAVALAEIGITASADALDGPTGLLTALSASHLPDRARPFSGWGALAIETIRPSIKKYPVCYAAHRVIDGMLDLRARHALAPDAVTRIHAYVSPTNRKVLKYARPDTPLEAKFSMQFACACALMYGEVSLHRLSEESLHDPAVIRLMERVEVHDVEPACPLEPTFAFTDRVVVETGDGAQRDSGEIRFARGHAQLPLTRGELEAKFIACVPPAERAMAVGLIARLSQLLQAPGARMS
jgi:2-methylcitrate dehydratase PrpD